MKTEQQLSYFQVGCSANPEEWVWSNSALSTINPSQGGHPRKTTAFFSENKEEETTKSLEKGKLVHLYMENPEKFAISTVPKPSDKLEIAADNIIRDLITATDDVWVTDDIILANVRAVGWNSKWGDDAILKNTRDQISSYVNEVLASKGKHILSEATAKTVTSCIKSINENELIQTLCFSLGENEVVFNELEIYWEVAGRKFKAKLDKIVIDTKAKLVRHFDFKTTSNPISKFEDAFENYRYYRQFAFYDNALLYAMQQQCIPIDITEFKVMHYVVVVETTDLFCSTVWQVSDFWLNEGQGEILQLNFIIDEHYKANNWTQTYVEILNYGYSRFRNVRRNEAWY